MGKFLIVEMSKIGLFLDKLLYFDPEHVFCNTAAPKITTAYHQSNLNMQVLERTGEIHKTQVVMDHVKDYEPHISSC